MTQSPKTFTDEKYENTRHNKGVEAKENECIDTVDSPKSCNGSLYSQVRNVINRLAENDDEDFSVATNASSAVVTEDSGSYLQVTIKKHHSKKESGRPSLKGVKKLSSQQTPEKTDKRQILHHVSATPSQASTPSKKHDCLSPSAKNTDSQNNKEYTDVPAAPGLYVLTQPMILTPYPNYMCPVSKQQGSGDKSKSLSTETLTKPMNTVTKSGNFDQNYNIDTNRVVYEDESKKEASAPSVGKQWLHDNMVQYKIHEGVSRSTNQSPNTKEERAELYYFDHGNPHYYSTTDCSPATRAEDLATRMEVAATKFWAEVFGVAYVAVVFMTTFFLQLERFILSGIIRPILIGFLQTLSDYLFKPLLAVLFNAVLQPPLLLLYNVFASISDLFKPIAKCVGYFVKELARLLKSFRLVNVKQRNVTSKV